MFKNSKAFKVINTFRDYLKAQDALRNLGFLKDFAEL